MTAISTQAVRFVAPWRRGEPAAPAFFLRAGTVMERAGFEAELEGPWRAGRVFAVQLTTALIDGIRSVFADDPERDRLVEIAQAEGVLEVGEELPAADRDLLAEVKTILAERWSAYRQLVLRQARRQHIAPILAFRTFCVGMENVDADFRRDPAGLVREESLAAIDDLELLVAGREAYQMQFAGHQSGN